MKACEEWLKLCPMLGYTDGSDTQLVIRAQEDGFRAGWQAALRGLRENEDAHCCGDVDTAGNWVDCPKSIAIEQELGDERKPE